MSSRQRTWLDQLDAEQRATLTQEGEKELAQRSIASSVAYVLALSVILLTTNYAVDHAETIATIAGLLGVLGLSRLYLALNSHVHWRSDRWIGAFFFATTANASVWSFLTCHSLLVHGFDTTSLLILLATAGVCAGGTTSLSPRPVIHLTFLFVLLIPPAVAAVWVGGPDGADIAASLGIFLIFLILQGRQHRLEYRTRAVNTLLLASRAEELSQQIAERERAESALRRSEARLRSLIEHAPVCIHEIDLEGKLTSMNAAGLRMMKLHDELEVLDSDYLGAVADADRERIAALMALAFRGESSQFEFRGTVDGRSRVFASCFVPIRGGDSQVQKLLGISEDITARKLAEEKLREATEVAVEALRVKSEFLANVSHEIRTPMNGVIGVTEILMDEPLTSEQREHVETIRSCGESLLTVINDVLDFSKAESGQLELEKVPFHLGDLVAEALRPLAMRAHAKSVALACDVSPDLPWTLEGDPSRLRQVLVNLVGNAVKFTDRGEIVIRARVSSRGAQEVEVAFDVADTGIGIPAEKQMLIFEPFTQADGSTTRKYGGTGLGLSISRTLLELMGGALRVSSAPGVGSTFSWKLPFTCRQQDWSADGPSLEGARVLVVGDHETSRSALLQLLRSWKAEAYGAESGVRALTLVEEAVERGVPPDLVLLDQVMPERDGLAHPALDQTPILLLTCIGGHQPGLDRAARPLRTLRTLLKPAMPTELRSTIEQILGLRSIPAPMSLYRRQPAENGRSLRVLVAEDNPVNAKVVSAMLKRMGHRVLAVANGFEALECLGREPIDVVLMDVQMPVMDGFQAVATLRAQEERIGGHLPVIALTAHAMNGDEERCIEAGMDAYLSKPIKSEELRMKFQVLVPA